MDHNFLNPDYTPKVIRKSEAIVTSIDPVPCCGQPCNCLQKIKIKLSNGKTLTVFADDYYDLEVGDIMVTH